MSTTARLTAIEQAVAKLVDRRGERISELMRRARQRAMAGEVPTQPALYDIAVLEQDAKLPGLRGTMAKARLRMIRGIASDAPLPVRVEAKDGGGEVESTRNTGQHGDALYGASRARYGRVCERSPSRPDRSVGPVRSGLLGTGASRARGAGFVAFLGPKDVILDTYVPVKANGQRGSEADPPGSRKIRLDTIRHVRREISTLYHEGKNGHRDVGDVARLAHVLSIAGRLIEGNETQQRLAALEAKVAELAQP